MKTCKTAENSGFFVFYSKVSKFPSWPAVKNSERNLFLPGNEVSSFGSTWVTSKIATDKAFFVYRKNRTIKKSSRGLCIYESGMMYRFHAFIYFVMSCNFRFQK